jgi:hypothetical protein
MMEAETVYETFDYNASLARLIAREDLIAQVQGVWKQSAEES